MKRPVTEILNAVSACLARHGLVPDDAAAVAEHLVEADMWGRAGHGVNLRLKQICEKLDQRGGESPRTRIAKDCGSAVRIDADNELGYLMIVRGAELAIDRVSKHGLAIVGVSCTTHTGMLGYSTFLVARAGFVSIAFSHCCPLVLPFGGAESLLGTNPLSFAFPREPYPILVDMATSAVTYGQCREKIARNEPIEPGCAIDADGNPTTDPAKALEGALLPLGGVKGTALATAIQLMSGVLTGAAPVPPPQQDYGFACIAMQPDLLRGDNGYQAALEEYVRALDAIPAQQGREGPRLPGARAFASREKALAEGLDIDDALWNDLIVEGSAKR
ncbi:Ldh family oxidoreductase [Verrucomicrobiota bacterium]